MTIEPLASIAEIAAAYRRELATDWLTDAQVGRTLGSKADKPSNPAADQRRAGKLLGVWVPSERAYRYPPWQFRSDGTPVPRMREILQLLRENGGVIDHGRRTSGWNEVEWFITPHVLLQGQRPADRLAEDADTVLRAARIEFVEDPDSKAW